MADQHAATGAALNQLLNLSRNAPEGLSSSVIEEKMGNVDVTIRLEAINILLKKGQWQLFKKGDGSIWYKEQSREEAAKFKGLQPEDLLVYQAIQASQNDGIWTKDIKRESNLQQPQMNKALKNLEARNLIKLAPSLQKNKKIYILAELKPSEKITGGAWYSGQEFDLEFVNAIKEQCFQFVNKQKIVTLEQVANFIRKSGMTKDDLNTKNFKQLMDVLVLDGDLVEVISSGVGDFSQFSRGAVCYRASKTRISDSSAFTNIPCGVCPVLHLCCEGGIISPQTCVYFKEWY